MSNDEQQVNIEIMNMGAEEAVDALLAAGIIQAAAAEDAIVALQAAQKDEIEALYVQTAESIVFEDGVLTLNGLAPTALWFSDRPDRDVGHVTSEEFMNAWGEGEDSFAADPPNATLSILSQDDITNVVVVLSDPTLAGARMSYKVDILEGEIPATGGPSALFIDVVGRPLTPVSVAGVHRRTRRRGRRRGSRRARR